MQHPLLPLLLAVSLATSVPAHPRSLDLSTLMPGDMHVSALVDLAALGRDFPGLLADGSVAERLDSWAAAGWPDPRLHPGPLGLAANFEGKSLRELAAWADGGFQVREPARRVAERLGIETEDRPYRGTLFLVLKSAGAPLAVADLGGEIAFAGYDARSEHRVGPWTVDTVSGQKRSLRQVHGLGLVPGTYLVAAVNVPKPTAVALAEATGIPPFETMLQGALAWSRSGNRMRIGCELTTRTAIEAKLLAWSIRKALDEWKAKTDDPTLRWLLDHITVVQSGKRVEVKLDAEFASSAPALSRLAIRLR